SRIGVGELSFVYVEVTYPALSVQRRKLLACPLGDVGDEEVIQNDVGKRCCRQVALAHLGKRSLEHLHLTDDINGLITLVARSDHCLTHVAGTLCHKYRSVSAEPCPLVDDTKWSCTKDVVRVMSQHSLAGPSR